MSQLIDLYSAERLPVLQNTMYSTRESARGCGRGDVILCQDLSTGLVFNRAFDPELVVYDQNYQNEQARSATFRAHLEAVEGVVRRHLEGKRLISVGCGKGYFLEHLQGLGFAIKGFDPTYEGDNPAIFKEFFTKGLELHADGLILRHVLEHVVDPVGFLHDMAESNGGTGKIYIEVPCLDWICENNAWFDIFYEHVNYFRLDDFRRIFGTLHEEGHLFGGQYIYVVADLATVRTPIHDDACPFVFPGQFLGTINAYASALKSQGGLRRSIVWGGASKGVIFTLLMNRAGVDVDHVVDINPAKQGKFLPATGQRVCSFDEVLEQLDRPGDIFVMNSNYLAEIKALAGPDFEYHTVDSGA